MVQTKAGGIKAAKTNYERHGKDFYKRIGSKGGKVCGICKGFAISREYAAECGRKGGRISRRGKAKNSI